MLFATRAHLLVLSHMRTARSHTPRGHCYPDRDQSLPCNHVNHTPRGPEAPAISSPAPAARTLSGTQLSDTGPSRAGTWAGSSPPGRSPCHRPSCGAVC